MKALGLFVLLFSTSVWSGVTDVEFIPEQGNLYLKSTFKLDSESRTETIPQSQKIEERDQSSMIVETSLMYGLFKNLEVGLEWNVTMKDETTIESQKINGVTYTANNGTTDYHDDAINNPGLQDPLIKARYRMPLPGGYGFMFDIFSEFSPGLGDAERGDSDDNPKQNLEGNSLWGGHRVKIGAGINQDIDQFQWSFNFFAQMNMERTIKFYDASNTPATHSIYTIDTYNDFTFEAKVLYEMIDQVHLLGTLAFIFNGSQDWNNQTSTIYRNEVESHSDIEIGLHAYWNFSQMLSVRLGYVFTSLGGYDNDSYQNNSLFSTTKYSDLSKSSIQAGLDFSF